MRGGAVLLLICCSSAAAAEQPAEPAETEIVVQGTRHVAAPSELRVSGETAREAAGTQGDPAKVLQSLPGVGRGGLGAELVLWGSEPRESLVEVDGVEVPRLYHGSGVRSVIPAALIGSVTSVPGGYGPERGRALGGFVLLETQPVETLKPRLRASADVLDASALGSVPLPSINGGAAAGVRYGYVDRWLPRFIDPALRGHYRVPQYWDAHAELDHRLSATQTARVVFIGSSDQSQSELLGDDAARQQHTRDAQNFGRLYLLYRDAGDGRGDGETTFTPFVGWDKSEQTLTVGGQSSGVRSAALRYGLRAQHRAQLGRNVGLTLGVDASGQLARVDRQGSLSVPRREGDPYPFGTPPGSGYASDAFRAHLLGAAPFLEAELRLGSGLRVSPGLRLETSLVEASRERPPLGDLPDIGKSQLTAALEPRLLVEQRLSNSVRLFASGGRYHQQPDAVDLSARFGNPSLTPASASHLVLGESALLPTRTRVEVTAFAKWLNGLPTRAADPQPRIGQALVASGSGRAFGTQLFLRQAEVHGFNAWLSATLSRSERAGPDGQLRLSDYDSPLVLALSVLQRLGDFRLGARARFASGTPRTPVVAAFYDAAAERYQPLLGPLNSTRLRHFLQLDLRLDRRFELGDGAAIELYVDALNVTAARNQEELAYSSDFTRVGSVSSLPPLASVGITVER